MESEERFENRVWIKWGILMYIRDIHERLHFIETNPRKSPYRLVMMNQK